MARQDLRSNLSAAHPVDLDGDIYFILKGWWPLEDALQHPCSASGHNRPVVPGKWVSVSKDSQLDCALCTHCAASLILNHGIGR